MRLEAGSLFIEDFGSQWGNKSALRIPSAEPRNDLLAFVSDQEIIEFLG
jgi:hypothetical protein